MEDLTVMTRDLVLVPGILTVLARKLFTEFQDFKESHH
jgi:hypothetical protein